MTSVLDLQPISAIDAQQWDRLWHTPYPFLQHAFFTALESSGCTDDASGWRPSHALLREGGRLSAAMPLYLKQHSYGEYVFDWAWANAYEQAGFAYYPKLVCACPFTPSTGPRLAGEASAPAALDELLTALGDTLASDSISGLHVLFPASGLAEHWRRAGLFQRLGCQFHWFNDNYASFDDFLSNLSSRKRKGVKKERKRIPEQEVEVTTLLGADITPEDWQAFYHLYARTYLKRSGHLGYLNLKFFQAIGAAMPMHTAIVKATRKGEWLAGALYFYDRETLYGRYWGTLQELDGLHFECCYYRGIELAIRLKLKRFDAGAQGEHKIQRGFVPVLTQSFHQLSHPQFHRAIQHHVQEENRQTLAYCVSARELLPFREGVDLPAVDCLIDGKE